jgi:PAS domain S-box-containing protein
MPNMKPTYKELENEISMLRKGIFKNKDVLDALPVGVVVYYENGEVYQYNKHFTKLFGYEHSDVPKVDDWFLLAYPDEEYRNNVSEQWFKRIEDYKKTGKFIPIEALVKCKDGTYKDIEFRFEAIGDIYLTTFVDFSKQKEIELQSKENEEKYRTLFHNANDAIFIMDQDVFIDCNQETLEMFECTKEQIIGSAPYDFSPLSQPDGLASKEKAKKLIKSALKKEIKVFEWMHCTYNKRLFYAEVSLNAVELKGKTYVQAIVRDINERKIAEIELEKYKNRLEERVIERTDELQTANEKLKLANNELKQFNRLIIKQKEELKDALDKLKNTQTQLVQSEKMASLGLLTSGVSHEINNPLNYIQAGIYSLNNLIDPETANFEQLELVLKHMQEGVNRVSKIVRGLNNFSRLSQNRTDLCDIHKILDNSILVFRRELMGHCEVEKNYVSKKVMISANKGELHHVFTNILQNAIHAIEEKGKIYLKTKITGNGYRVQITIKDNGKGIKKENMSKIYDPFFTTKEPGKGTGLGLSIAFRIIKEHKGTIKYSSELDKGTKALITLPINQ